MEGLALQKSNSELKSDIDSSVQHTKVDRATHQQYLVSANLNLLAKNGRQAISDMHKYFDYNMRQKQTKLNRETGVFEFVSWNTQVYQPALYKAGLCFRLGQYDQALASVRESIKISQSKNDSTFILHCLVWLKQIMAALGNKSQEMKILHHIIAQSTKGKKLAQHDQLISAMAFLNFVNHDNALKVGEIPKIVEKALLKLEV